MNMKLVEENAKIIDRVDNIDNLYNIIHIFL